MDRNAVIGFILIGLILMIWMWTNAPPPAKPPSVSDSSARHQTVPETAQSQPRTPARIEPTGGGGDTLGKYFSPLGRGQRNVLTIETGLYRAELSTAGGAIQSWVLKQYKSWDQHPVDLLDGTGTRDFNLIFYSSDGKLIDTKNLVFRSSFQNGQVIHVADQESVRVELVLPVNEKSRIIKSFVFFGNLYSFDGSYRFEKMEDIISNFEYQVAWESGIRYQERNSINESNFAKASAFAGGELIEVDANNFNEPVKQSLSGSVAWVAARNKYFAVAIIPREKVSQGAYLEGNRFKLPDNGAKETYSISLKMPFIGNPVETDRFTVFLGPLDYDVVKQYNVELDRIMSLGAVWVIRPISRYVIIPLFQFLRLFISNYGIVLIIFSIIVKVALYPLTKTSMDSMRKMQALQPMMTEIREKFKDDPQKMNQQIMRLYKEYGVNPAGGCLPMVLQLPILYALWAVFSATIELRQASFVGWIQDLSSPDIVTTLPFRIPFFNINEVSGLALLMGITMFVQQKMSVKDPRQKMMVYLMPVMLTMMFNSFPAGLNLYYFMFNLLSIAQQVWVNKQHKDEPLRKVDEKKGGGGIIGKLAMKLPKRQQ
ncbi:MAG: membrane protein insertase YidC [Ignavibacteria bacterium]|nr:MAG: membrane protein insertase YidC [Ignavibacteria bacterium]